MSKDVWRRRCDGLKKLGKGENGRKKQYNVLLTVTFCGASNRHQGVTQQVMVGSVMTATMLKATLVSDLFAAPCMNLITNQTRDPYTTSAILISITIVSLFLQTLGPSFHLKYYCMLDSGVDI